MSVITGTESDRKFTNRQQAGKELAAELAQRDYPEPVVLALPRGGVPVAYEVAQVLHAPLQVIVVRKLGAPQNPEYGVGAISEGSVVVLNEALLQALEIEDRELQPIMTKERQELERRKYVYRHQEPLPSLTGKTAILVDDGIATGYTMLAAMEAVTNLDAQKIVVAVPVCAADTAILLEGEVDELVCLLRPTYLQAVGLHYQEFDEVSDDEVTAFLSYDH
ncbi:MAG TPA: phosphoribosyltransferase [Patescibacteria group bacterium]